MSAVPTHSRGRHRRVIRRLSALGVALPALALPAVASANVNQISSGSAFSIGVKSGLLSTQLTVGPTVGPVSTNGTLTQSASAVSASTSLLSATGLFDEVQTKNENSTATSTIASATIPGLLFVPTIGVTALSATSTTNCHVVNGVHGTTTGAGITGILTVGGIPYNLADVPANTSVSIPLVGTLTVNEQITTGNSTTVNAIDLKLLAGTDVIIGSATSGVTNCGEPA